MVNYRPRSAQYHDFAEQCLRLAKLSKSDSEREVLHEMAEEWRRLAEETDQKHSKTWD